MPDLRVWGVFLGASAIDVTLDARGRLSRSEPRGRCWDCPHLFGIRCYDLTLSDFDDGSPSPRATLYQWVTDWRARGNQDPTEEAWRSDLGALEPLGYAIDDEHYARCQSVPFVRDDPVRGRRAAPVLRGREEET